jgi:hypothetical protein
MVATIVQLGLTVVVYECATPQVELWDSSDLLSLWVKQWLTPSVDKFSSNGQMLTMSVV